MKVKRNCLQCNKEFETYSSFSHIKRNAGYCCSRVCSSKYKWTQKEYIKKMSDSHIGNEGYWKGKGHLMMGENAPAWIEDRTQISQKMKLEEFRKTVKLRDENKCKINNKDCKGPLETHHILNKVEFPELRYDINNGITLCHAHHPRGRANEKRLSPYFMELVSVSKV